KTNVSVSLCVFCSFLVLPCCWSLQVSIPNKEHKVAKGKDVTIMCSFVPAVTVTDSFFLLWEAQPDVSGEPLPAEISPSYEGRASLEVDVNGGTSTLRLTKVTIKDSRHYQCSVRIFGDDEGTTAATTSVLVLGERTQTFGQDLCCCSEGSPKPTYQWTTYSVDNTPRQFPPKTTQKDGVLALFNITKETSGFFVCISSNEIDSASCNFTLAVMPGSMNLGSTAGIIGGVLAGLVVLGIIIFCCCRRKNKDKHPEDEEKQVSKYEDKDVLPQNKFRLPGMGQRLDDDQHSYNSGRDRHEEKGSDVDSQRYREDQQDRYRGSRDRLDDQRDRYGSHDRLDDQRDRYGSRDRLDDRQDRYGVSQDHRDYSDSQYRN
uniref:Glycoprotein A33 n=1 Tax=Kryptolebias marmoratus TaxID=37003 RepID=A0A3Q3EET7_KRYMA